MGQSVVSYGRLRINCSVFLTEGFSRPGTQVRRFGRKLNALDENFDANL